MCKIIDILRALFFPQVWVDIGVAVVGAVGSYEAASAGSSKGGSGGGQPYYQPGNLQGADTGWQQAFNQSGVVAAENRANTTNPYNQSLNAGEAVNYNPYVQAAQKAGGQYDWLAGQAGQEQQRAMAQQQALYGAGNQVMQTAMDPQSALYNRTQQQLQDQVRAGQAARGLGVSAVGAGLEDQAMSNFNIDWQNQQLARQVQGIQGASTASSAGGRQGEMAMAAGAAMPGYTLEGGQVPMQAQQYAAAQPGQVAGAYQGQMLGQQQMFGNVQSSAIPYLNYGQGAQQQNYMNQSAQNQANAALITQGAQGVGSALSTSYNTPGSWLNNTFGSGRDYQTGGTDYMSGTSEFSPSSTY